MKNILILGGLGFIGKNLLEEFSGDRRYSLIVFDRPAALKKAVRRKGVRYYGGDFDSQAALEKVFRENKVDTVLHLVSTTVPAASDGFEMVYDIESNLVPTVRLLCLMRKYGARKIVFASSGGTVYGPETAHARGGGIPENASTNPICSHGTVKLAIEKYIQLSAYLHGLEYLVLRISNPYGEYHSSQVQGLINVALRNVRDGKLVTVWGDGKVVRDYVYIADCVKAVKKLIDLGASGEIINVGSGKGYSVNEVLRLLRGLAGDFKIERKPGRKFDVPRVVLDIRRLKSLTGFRPTDIRTGIKNTLEWLRKKPE
ncbi:MAG: NAD-dependent epimerase/dehydratase family protein [Elusimicrobiales bacterium]|nr:NAD-dependent epimerase/dehydratase family protein [Elusimicrobiales bacterium]